MTESPASEGNLLLGNLESFVDREREIARINAALRDPGTAIIGVFGVAGIGKTSLARLVASQQEVRFPGSVVWINCGKSDSLPKIIATIADAIRLDSSKFIQASPLKSVRDYLKTTPTLLIFDEYELVAKDDEVFSFIGLLPKLTKAILLSRERIVLPGRGITLRLEGFTENQTHDLIKHYLPPERWTEITSSMLSQIYNLTGGLPALVAGVGFLLAQGQSINDFKAAGTLDRISEILLRTFEAKITRSEKKFLDALSIFANPVGGDAVAEIAQISDWISSAKSLERMSVVQFERGRFILHPLIRISIRNSIAPEILTELQSRMVVYYLDYLDRFQYDFYRIDQEWPNIQYAVETAYQNELQQYFIIIVLRLGDFIAARGYSDKYRQWLEQALRLSNELQDSSAQAVVLYNLGVHYQQSGELDTATGYYEQSLALKEELGNKAAESATLTNLGSVYRARGDIKQAINYYKQAIAISREVGDRLGEANIVGSLGVSYADTGDYEQAIAYYEQGLTIAREVGDRRGEASVLANLGAAHFNLKSYTQSIAFYEQALLIIQEIGETQSEASVLTNLGTVYLDLYARTGRETNLDVAIAHFQAALDIGEQLGDPHTVTKLYTNLGNAYRDLYARTGREANLDVAIAYFQRALDINQQLGNQRAEANLCTNLGSANQALYEATGATDNLHVAIGFYEKAANIIEVAEYPVEYATVLNNLGNAYASLGGGNRLANIEQAIGYYKKAIEVHPPDSPFVASSLHNLGVAFSQRAQFLGSVGSYLQAIEFLREALQRIPRQSPDWLRVAVNLVTNYVQVGNWSDARSLAENLLSDPIVATSSFEPPLSWYVDLGDFAIEKNDPEYATHIFAGFAYRLELRGSSLPSAIQNRLVELKDVLGLPRFSIIWAEARHSLSPTLAQILHEARELLTQEEYGVAATRLSDALSVVKEADSTQDSQRQKAIILSLRGYCLRKELDWEKALDDQREAFLLFEKLKDPGGEAQAFLEMGHLYEIMNNYEEAELCYMDAYRLFKKIDDKGGMAKSNEHLGRLEFREKKLAQAIRDLEEARILYLATGNRIGAAAIEDDLEDAKSALTHQIANDKENSEVK